MMTHVKRQRILALAVMLTAGGVADASGQDRAARMREVYPPAVATQIESLVQEAERSGIPTGPLYDKALEGAAKRVSPQRVVAALREYSGRMGRAQGLLGGTRETAWVVAGADALRRGVAEDALTTIGQNAGQRTPIALVVMGDLMEAGVPPARAMEVMHEALARTRGEEGLLEVPMALRRLVREGALAPDAARHMVDAMKRGISLRRVRHRPPGRPDVRPHARPVPPGSDPASRVSGTSG